MCLINVQINYWVTFSKLINYIKKKVKFEELSVELIMQEVNKILKLVFFSSRVYSEFNFQKLVTQNKEFAS